MENPFNDSIESLKESKNKAIKSIEESEDVKEGKTTVEEELQEPGYLLYNSIVENTIKILQEPPMVKALTKINNAIGEEASKVLVEILALCMTQSAHQSLLFYDDLIKDELIKQFDNIGTHINSIKGELDAHTAAMRVFRKELSDVTKGIEIDKFKKENGVE